MKQIHPPTILLCLLGALIGGCSKSSSTAPPRLEPLPDTGTQAIAMNGSWEVMGFEVLNELTTNDPLDFPWGAPVAGSTIEISGNQFRTAGTTSLKNPGSDASTEVFSYLNYVDGRRAYFDLGTRTRPDPNIADGGEWRIQFVFGSVSASQDEMLGLSFFDYAGFTGRARGTYRVRLRRR